MSTVEERADWRLTARLNGTRMRRRTMRVMRRWMVVGDDDHWADVEWVGVRWFGCVLDREARDRAPLACSHSFGRW
jgi:hypothetical protein